MDQKFKARWVAALQSGEYQQGQQQLRRGDKFCCLGVACDLIAKDGGGYWSDDVFYLKPRRIRDIFKSSSELSDKYKLPPALAKRLGIGRDPEVPGVIRDYVPSGSAGLHATLASLNDQGVPFHVIAEIIEEDLD
jgi:hypothetical protein